MCGLSVWNALHIRLPVEKYLTSQHRTPHVVRGSLHGLHVTEGSRNRTLTGSGTTGVRFSVLRVKIVGNISDADGKLFPYD